MVTKEKLLEALLDDQCVPPDAVGLVLSLVENTPEATFIAWQTISKMHQENPHTLRRLSQKNYTASAHELFAFLASAISNSPNEALHLTDFDQICALTNIYDTQIPTQTHLKEHLQHMKNMGTITQDNDSRWRLTNALDSATSHTDV